MLLKKQNSCQLKKKVSDIITLLSESQELANQTPDINPPIQTSLTFLLKAAIDLNYQIHDFMELPEKTSDTEASSS